MAFPEAIHVYRRFIQKMEMTSEIRQYVIYPENNVLLIFPNDTLQIKQ